MLWVELAAASVSAGLRFAQIASSLEVSPLRVGVFGITSNTLVRTSQSSTGTASGASDGHCLGSGAAGPDCLCTTTTAGALRVIVKDGSIRMSDHASPPGLIGNGVTGGPESVLDG